jgi:hypothetical protein
MLKTIDLLSTDKVAHNETLDHPAFVKKLTGIDPFEQPMKALASAARILDLDWLYGLPKRAFKFAENESKKKLGEHNYVTEWGFTGSVWHDESGFAGEDDVLSYDPFAPYKNLNELHESIRRGLQHIIADQDYMGCDAVVTGLYYTTLFQWFILTFGWEMFLVTAAASPDPICALRRQVPAWVVRKGRYR